MWRVGHRDGRLLRGGIGLTTGLGWSDRYMGFNVGGFDVVVIWAWRFGLRSSQGRLVPEWVVQHCICGLVLYSTLIFVSAVLL